MEEEDLRKKLHDAHNEYPLAAERLVIRKFEKLTPNLNDKTKSVYKIQTEDFYKDISGDVERLFDTSNYPKDHLSKIPMGKKQESHWDVQRRGWRKDYSGICRTESETLHVQNVGRKGRKEVQRD